MDDRSDITTAKELSVTKPVRVRFAPSPTGNLHIGGARTAIYNWAFARHHGGTFILRIDDTDPERSTVENTEAILHAMKWLGLDWDEGPEVGGSHGPYFQTQRFALYAEGLERMKATGHAYPCFCTAEDLAAKREAGRSGGGPSGYDRTCRDLTFEEAASRIAAGEAHVWRLRVPLDHGDVVFTDAIRGDSAFPIEAMDDFVLVRSDGTPTYNFATVLDDVAMEITHVVRGDDHLSNTPRQVLVFEALEAPVPVFAHLSMIWGSDGKRLSKRHGATSVQSYEEAGYLPEALVNYLALLGWSLDGETTLFSAETLVENFSLERISKNPAIFDSEKLEWMNGVYLREMDAETFSGHLVRLVAAAGLMDAADADARRDWLLKLAPLVSERIKRLDEVVPMVSFLFVDEVEMDDKARDKALAKEGIGAILDEAAGALSSCDWTVAAIEEALRTIPERMDAKVKPVFQAIRAALTGTLVSPPLFESIELLGRERTLQRLEKARALAG